MSAITLPLELELAVAEEAAMQGTTVELLTLDVLHKRFLSQTPIKPLPEGATLADALAGYIGAISTHDKYPEGSTLSENTGRKFARLMVDKWSRGKL